MSDPNDAEFHWRRYLADRSPADLRIALELYDQLLAVRADLVPRRVLDALVAAHQPETGDIIERGQYAALLIDGARRTRDPGDIDRAVDVLRAVTTDAGPDHEKWHAYLSDLSLILQLRHRRTHRAEDLDEAVQLSRQAVRAAPQTDSDLPTMRSNLASGLLVRYRLTGDPTDLQESIEVARHATSAPGRDDPGLALRTLSDTLRQHADRSGDLSALDEAINAGRASVTATPAGDVNLVGRTSQLAIALLTRFEKLGRPADLDECIELLRRARAADDGASERILLTDLSVALQRRFSRTGEPADLDEAIGAATSALNSTDSDEAAAIASDLSAYHLTADFTRAVNLSREALERTPDDHAFRPGRQANLANALRRRFEAGSSRADIDEAVTVLTSAADKAPGDLRILFNLAGALRVRHERLGSMADLAASTHRYRQALDTAPPDHPERATILAAYAATLESGDHQSAITAWRKAAGMRQARTATRLGAATAWSRTSAAHGDWASATEGYTTAVNLLPVIASRAVGRAARESLLARAAGVALEACASAVNPARAVALADQGRAVLWAQMLDIRADLTALQATAPRLADRVAAVGAALDG